MQMTARASPFDFTKPSFVRLASDAPTAAGGAARMDARPCMTPRGMTPLAKIAMIALFYGCCGQEVDAPDLPTDREKAAFQGDAREERVMAMLAATERVAAESGELGHAEQLATLEAVSEMAEKVGSASDDELKLAAELVDSFLKPIIFPNDANHREHMETWCNGKGVRESGGVGPPPHLYGTLHFNHMQGYCRARAKAHEMADELWSGPPFVFVLLAIAFMFVMAFCCCGFCSWIIQRQKPPVY